MLWWSNDGGSQGDGLASGGDGTKATHEAASFGRGDKRWARHGESVEDERYDMCILLMAESNAEKIVSFGGGGTLLF